MRCYAVMKAFQEALGPITPGSKHPNLDRDATLRYLHRGLVHLSAEYACLDASRPWLIYWILHALELLGEEVRGELKTKVCITTISIKYDSKVI